MKRKKKKNNHYNKTIKTSVRKNKLLYYEMIFGKE